MNEKIKLRIKQVLSAIALVGNSMLLRDSFSMLAFEIKYFAEYKEISWVLRYGFFAFANLVTLLLLLDYFMKVTREIRVARDLEVENEMHREYKNREYEGKKILKDSDEVDPEELKDLLQKDYSSQKKSSQI